MSEPQGAGTASAGVPGPALPDLAAFPKAGPEEAALAGLCSQSILGGVPPALPRDLDWNRLAALAQRHRVVPLVARHAARLAEAGMPETVANGLRAQQRQVALDNLRMAGHLVTISRALAADGIALVPLKGVALAAELYGSIGARQTGDLDFLVPEDRIDRADEIIRSLGHRRLSAETHLPVPEDFEEDRAVVRHFNYATSDGILIEMHIRLHKNPALTPVTVAGIKAAGHTVKLAGAELASMPRPLQFTFLATHGARHTWKRLQWICDIAAMVRDADRAELLGFWDEANRQGLALPAAQALILSHELLSTPLPTGARRLFDRSPALRFMMRRARLTLFRSLKDEPDDPGGFDPAVRLYRLCMTKRLDYHWHEVRRSIGVLGAKLGIS